MGRWAASHPLLRDGAFPPSPGGDYLGEAIRVFLGGNPQVLPSDDDNDRFPDHRHNVLFPPFAAFLIAFASETETTAPAAADSGSTAPVTAVIAPRQRSRLLMPGGAIAAALLIVLLSRYLVFRAWPFAAIPQTPSTGPRSPAHAGALYWEQEGHLGEPATYADPLDPAVTGPGVQPLAKVHVSCKVYAPSFPSVSPDGYWYRLRLPDAGVWPAPNSTHSTPTDHPVS